MLCFALQANAFDKKRKITIAVPEAAAPRIVYGAEKLLSALQSSGYKANIIHTNSIKGLKHFIAVGRLEDSSLGNSYIATRTNWLERIGKEGFVIYSVDKNGTYITGRDNSGALYGCLEMADRVKSGSDIIALRPIKDQPQMVLRGACVGVQKPYYLPGRTVYEYPYTPETFPWLYDKKLWVKYLDSLAENRMNSLYLWNGHPFASLVRLKDYPYAVEVDDATFKKNEEMFRFLTTEADRRGIWVIQMFYNIIVSKPFAEKNNIKTQDRERHITPLIADYTRKSLAAFVAKYPNVGLLITLGEAMEGVGQDDIDWFTKTIIPGVQDGLKELGRTDEPPIVLRAHDTDAPSVMKEAMPLYKNLFTMAKYNGEALTTYTPRGTWAQLHRKLSSIGTVHIENVHLLSNLEPFRYASADFIQKSVQAMHSAYGANGLHLYPQASYWDWPYTADKTSERLLEIDRDWLWYRQWSRYAWNCDRDSAAENNYWSRMIAADYGAPKTAGQNILKAYEETGEIAPKLLRRFGITDGNRQTLTLGMQMTQLINPYRYGLFTMLYESEAPEGEPLYEYAAKDWKGEKHVGETPVIVINEVKAHAAKAVQAIDNASAAVTKNKVEFARLKNDIYCYNALANTYADKAAAALLVLRYKYSNDIADLEKALPLLEKSVAAYQQLCNLTKNTYLYANSMQTQQRKIPFRGVDGTYKTWVEILPHFENEVVLFKKHIDSLKSTKPVAQAEKTVPFPNADFKITSQNPVFYTVDGGASVFSDTTVLLKEFAPELQGLKGLRLSKSAQATEGTTIQFTNNQPVKILVGFFKKKADLFDKSTEFLKEPELETNATANDFGQAEIKITNAMVVDGMPPVNIHTYSFPAGSNTLVLAKGACLILGFIPESQPVKVYDAGLNDPSAKNVDWLFE